MTNIFREAKQLWEKKANGSQLTGEEEELIGAALIPLMLLPRYRDTPVDQGLEKLAVMVEGSSGTEHRT